ncbi:hypothetical protein GCM10009578_041500 [Streptomyces rhizosphaericus]
MPMRSERPRPDAPVDSGTGRRGGTGALPAETMAGLGFALYAGAKLPGVVMADGTPDGNYQMWLHDRNGSAATVTQEEVWSYGPRRLWEEATAVHEAYVNDGSPGPGDFGLTVSPGGQRLWLRSPDTPLD